ncbi:MAG: hypothetical protein HY899_14545 [Deltaproteobacteria bacterium]|nr:hypothetical protein [Deltaproteobacteria bacterium]
MKPLRIFAVLFALLAASNFAKPLGVTAEQGFVFLGRRLEGTPNLLAGWSFAVFLAAYAMALWRDRIQALPMGLAYAGYVSANLYLFTLMMPAPQGNRQIFGIVYSLLALAGAWGAVAVMLREGFVRRERETGRILLRSFALLFALMALSDALKPFAYTPTTGFVLFGQRLSGTANTIAALSFSALLACYAHAIWNEKRRALPLGIAYAAYVAANLLLWNLRKPEGSTTPLLFALPYLVSAIGVSSGAALLLRKHRHRLR